jgi:hypothetical protein
MSVNNTIDVDDIQEKINRAQKLWSQVVKDLTIKVINEKLQHLSDVQAEAISNRQLVVDEIAIYSAKIWREKQKIKKLEKSRFEFYATSYAIKTSGAEKLRLINADLSDRQLVVDLYDEHINHLRETAKNMEAINYNVKNKIQAFNIIGGYE